MSEFSDKPPVYNIHSNDENKKRKYRANLKNKIDLYKTQNRNAVSRNAASGLWTVFQVGNVLYPLGEQELDVLPAGCGRRLTTGHERP